MDKVKAKRLMAGLYLYRGWTIRRNQANLWDVITPDSVLITQMLSLSAAKRYVDVQTTCTERRIECLT